MAYRLAIFHFGFVMGRVVAAAGKHRNGKCVPGFRERFLAVLDLHRRDYKKVAPKERVLFPDTWSL